LRAPIPFGRHLLLERIAVGGMAEVFRAKSFGIEGFERILAVKRILPTLAEDSDFVRMFVDEARIASVLTHQNIVQIFELGKHDDSYFIAMEYVAGKDLRGILDRIKKQKKPMPEGMACFVISKICEALDHAHRKRDPSGKDLKIIHRDVSPQNVILSYEGEVKLCDFGIAKAVTQSTRTQVGVLKGKFAYMSPEQVKCVPIDRRSDLFALGGIMYEMLTGERLFLGDNDYDTLEAVREAVVTPPRQFNAELSPRLEQIVLKMLAREPEDRFQWASDVLEELYKFLAISGQFYHAHHLRQFMQSSYAKDIEVENQKLQEYLKVKAPNEITVQGDDPSARQITADDADGPHRSSAPPAERTGADDMASTVLGDDDEPSSETTEANKNAPLSEVRAELLAAFEKIEARSFDEVSDATEAQPRPKLGPDPAERAADAWGGKTTLRPQDLDDPDRPEDERTDSTPARPANRPTKERGASAADVEERGPSLPLVRAAGDAGGTSSDALPVIGSKAALRFRTRRKSARILGVLGGISSLAALFIILWWAGQGRSSASLRIESTPVQEVDVFLDGHLVASRTPLVEDALPLGKHQVELRAKGFQVYQQSFTIQEARPHTLTIPLEAQPVVATVSRDMRAETATTGSAGELAKKGTGDDELPPKADPSLHENGFLVATTEPPGVPMLVDGRPTGLKTPLVKPFALAEGKHTISFELPEGKRFDFGVSIAAGGTTKLVKRLRATEVNDERRR
jgi:serine/threonine protein kinase